MTNCKSITHCLLPWNNEENFVFPACLHGERRIQKRWTFFVNWSKWGPHITTAKLCQNMSLPTCTQLVQYKPSLTYPVACTVLPKHMQFSWNIVTQDSCTAKLGAIWTQVVLIGGCTLRHTQGTLLPGGSAWYCYVCSENECVSWKYDLNYTAQAVWECGNWLIYKWLLCRWRIP